MRHRLSKGQVLSVAGVCYKRRSNPREHGMFEALTFEVVGFLVAAFFAGLTFVMFESRNSLLIAIVGICLAYMAMLYFFW